MTWGPAGIYKSSALAILDGSDGFRHQWKKKGVEEVMRGARERSGELWSARGPFLFSRGGQFDLSGWQQAAFAALLFFLLVPALALGQDQVIVSDFQVLDWFKSVRLTWRAAAPPGVEAIFEIYRSDKETGPYSLVQEVRMGDREFIDVITKSYTYYDKRVEAGRRYYYKLALKGTSQVFGPFGGLASGAPPGT